MNSNLKSSIKILINITFYLTFFNTESKGNDTSSVLFFSGSIKELLTKAKIINKAIFIDVSTTWCKPCRVMKKEAFIHPDVSSILNKNFISYEIDAEKGEGKIINSNYSVTEYPTILFIMPDQTLVHRVVGYSGVKQLLEEINKAMLYTNGSNSIYKLKKEYESGNKNKDFLIMYVKKLDSLGLSTDRVLDTYLTTLNNNQIHSEGTVELLSNYVTTTQSKSFKILTDYVKINKDSILNEKIANKLYSCLSFDFNNLVSNPNENKFQQFLRNSKQINSMLPGYDLKDSTVHAENYKRRYYSRIGNFAKYKPWGKKFAIKLMNNTNTELKNLDSLSYINFLSKINNLPDTTKATVIKKYGVSKKHVQSDFVAEDLCEIATVFLSSNASKQDLLVAKKWIQRAIDLNPLSRYFEIKAILEYKLGNIKNAIYLQEQALNICKKEGKDINEYQNTFAKIKSRTL